MAVLLLSPSVAVAVVCVVGLTLRLTTRVAGAVWTMSNMSLRAYAPYIFTVDTHGMLVHQERELSLVHVFPYASNSS
jgi:hypothetical protein